MTLAPYQGDLLAQTREWTNLHDEELRRRAVRAAADKDVAALVSLTTAYLAHQGGSGVLTSPRTVEAYARGITLDTGRIEDAVRTLDPSDASALQEALSSGMFEPEKTPAQQAALERLETALALVEGWVDHVVDAATSRALPSSAALREAVRRRRATGGPAEHVMAGLVGLELRPRRLREASRLWSVTEDALGAAGRDAVWAHPDLLPTAADLDDPDGFASRRSDAEAADADVDAALEALLRGEGPAAPPESPESGGGSR